MNCIVIAAREEAEPFIRAFELAPDKQAEFKIFAGNNIALSVSGIGKVNAAAACAYLILRYQPERIFNFGTAGALNSKLKLWDIRQISAAFEWDKAGGRHIKFACFENIANGVGNASLATGDMPVVAAAEREKLSILADLADMEGAAIAKICSKFGCPCHGIKIVSDTSDTQTNDIMGNIRHAAQMLSEFVVANSLLNA